MRRRLVMLNVCPSMLMSAVDFFPGMPFRSLDFIVSRLFLVARYCYSLLLYLDFICDTWICVYCFDV